MKRHKQKDFGLLGVGCLIMFFSGYLSTKNLSIRTRCPRSFEHSLNDEKSTTKQLIQSDTSKEIISLQKEAIKWRRIAGKLSCQIDASGVGPTGGWCLRPSAENWGELGRAAEHHVVADSGIGKALMKYLKRSNEKPLSLLDIGAGVGQYGYWLKVNGADLDWTGYDGAENVEEFTNGFVQWTDVTNKIFNNINFTADWVMSLECGEHIPSENTDDLISLLDRHNRLGIILSWAVPGQGGHSHINERSNENIIMLMSERGYIQDNWCLEFQEYGRQEAIYFWFKGTFMVFKRKV